MMESHYNEGGNGLCLVFIHKVNFLTRAVNESSRLLKV